MALSVTPSDIIQYLYCPRFSYFEKVLAIPQYEEKSYKVKRGRVIHEQKQATNKEYLRKKIGVVNKWQEQYLTNELLRGKVDEVLELKDGSLAPLDYKFAKYTDKVFSTYKTQLYSYALLIEDNFGKPVHKGFLVYTRSRNKLITLDISEADKQNVRNCALAIQQIVEQNLFPKATRYKKRCIGCTYANICIK